MQAFDIIRVRKNLPIARRYGRVYHDFDVASKWHMGIHIWGNISNVILYYELLYSEPEY